MQQVCTLPDLKIGSDLYFWLNRGLKARLVHVRAPVDFGKAMMIAVWLGKLVNWLRPWQAG